MNLCVIGMGKMGATFVKALLARDVIATQRIIGTTAHQASAERLSARLGVAVTTDNIQAIRDRDVIVLAVKPQKIVSVLERLRPHLNPNQILISMAAATSLAELQRHLPQNSAVIRAMPNLPIEVGQGMTVLCPGKHVSSQQMQRVKALFERVGRVAVIDNQDLMDAVTALSGSGPAYAYIIIESLAEGGVMVGLPRSLATTLAAQAMLGAAAMVLETQEHPAKLKDMVTTPAGTTVDGILALEEGSLRVALIKAVDAATTKAKELGLS